MAIFGAIAILALGGMLWTSVATPTGNYVGTDWWINNQPTPDSNEPIPTAGPISNAWTQPPNRQAFACVCKTPLDQGTCAVSGCFTAASAFDRCISTLPEGSTCQQCVGMGSLQRVTTGVHVIDLATCNTWG